MHLWRFRGLVLGGPAGSPWAGFTASYGGAVGAGEGSEHELYWQQGEMDVM